MNEKLDYIPGYQIAIKQDNRMFKINSDTYCLSQFMKVKKDEIVMDIGTNNGALLLVAHQFSPKQLIGVDINAEALQLAHTNFELHHIERFILINQPIQNVPPMNVDVIVCNPPYFSGKNIENVCKNTYKAMAKFDDYLPLEDLIKAVSTQLKSKGRCYLIYRSNCLEKLFSTCSQYPLVIKRIQPIFDARQSSMLTLCIEIVKDGKSGLKMEKPFVLKGETYVGNAG